MSFIGAYIQCVAHPLYRECLGYATAIYAAGLGILWAICAIGERREWEYVNGEMFKAFCVSVPLAFVLWALIVMPMIVYVYEIC